MNKPDENQLINEWPRAEQYGRTIRLEFSLFIAAFIIILMTITGYIITKQYVDGITRSVAERLLVQARSYSASAGKMILSSETPDALSLNNICKKLTADNPDIYWAGIADKKNIYIAHSVIQRVISGDMMKEVTAGQFQDMLMTGEAFDLDNDTILIAIPIVESGITVGHLKVASSARQIVDARNNSIITVVTITLLMMVLGIPLIMIILNRKLRPIKIITDSLRRVDFDNIEFNVPIKAKNEFGYLAETLHYMGGQLNIAQRELIEKERISRELEIAHEIQSRIQPRNYPQRPEYRFAGTYRSAREVGGDYFDIIEYDDGSVLFLVADVSGKSLPGMLVMLMTRDIVRHTARRTTHPSELLCRVNRELLPNIKRGMFVTMFAGHLNVKNGLFTFASAGHNPLIKLHPSHPAELIKTKGFPLGMMAAEQFDKRIESGWLSLVPDDCLVLFTDGINEAQNEAKEEFGMERFIQALEQNKGRSPDELIKNTLETQLEFVGNADQYDDLTILTMSWQGTAANQENKRINTKSAHGV